MEMSRLKLLHYLQSKLGRDEAKKKKKKRRRFGINKITYTLLSVMDMESSVVASLEISLSLALVAGAKM